MRHITVVDARMGRGKSTAAIRYMNEKKDDRRFLYITPYLSEVARVCDDCGFIEPVSEEASKSAILKQLLAARKNIASTHALFALMDDEALELARAGGYSLIIDESPEVLSHIPASKRDTELMLANLIDVGEDMRVTWREPGYEGKFSGYKDAADEGALLYVGGAFYEVMSPKMFLPFRDVFLLTYLFDGQLVRAYFDFFGFEYNIIGIETDEDGFRFSNRPDDPPNVDYTDLIRIVDDERMNAIGNGRTALSVSWYRRYGGNSEDIRILRNNLRNFFDRMTGGTATRRLWTVYKDYIDWMLGPRRRYYTSYLALNARATNAHREAENVAYLVNRFVDPNIAKFFSSKDIKVDSEQFALSELVQFIWRSAIRDDKPINLYIPSRRMRDLLTGWMKTVNGGE